MKTLTVPAERDQLDTVQGFVDEALDQTDCSLEARLQLQIAVEELFVNIASYAYAPGSGQAVIGCQLEQVFFQIERKEHARINAHRHRRVAVLDFRHCQSRHRSAVGNVLHRQMSPLACQLDLLAHYRQILRQRSRHYLSKCILSHNCLLSYAKVIVFV